jgi:cell division septation protein DedD
MRRLLSALFVIGATMTLLSCGPSDADIQNEAQARRDSLAQVLAQREMAADSTQSTPGSEMQQEFDFSDSGRFVVQVGSWRSKTKAEELVNVWKSRGYTNAYIEPFGNESIGDVWFRVRLGRMPSESDADALVRLIQDRHGLVAWVDTITIP